MQILSVRRLQSTKRTIQDQNNRTFAPKKSFLSRAQAFLATLSCGRYSSDSRKIPNIAVNISTARDIPGAAGGRTSAKVALF